MNKKEMVKELSGWLVDKMLPHKVNCIDLPDPRFNIYVRLRVYKNGVFIPDDNDYILVPQDDGNWKVLYGKQLWSSKPEVKKSVFMSTLGLKKSIGVRLSALKRKGR